MEFRLFYTGKTTTDFDPVESVKIVTILRGKESSLEELRSGEELLLGEGLSLKKAEQLISRLQDKYGLLCRKEPMVDELGWELAPIEKKKEKFVCPACGHEEDFKDEDDTQETHVCSQCGRVAGKVLKYSERERIRSQIKAARESREAQLKKELEEQELLEERDRIRKEIEAGEPQLLHLSRERRESSGFPIAALVVLFLVMGGAGYGTWYFISNKDDSVESLASSKEMGYDKKKPSRHQPWQGDGEPFADNELNSGETASSRSSDLFPNSVQVSNQIEMPTVMEKATQIARENEELPIRAKKKDVSMNYRPEPAERIGPVVIAEEVGGNRRDAERMVSLVGKSSELVQSAGKAALEEKKAGREQSFIRGTDFARKIAQEIEDSVDRAKALAKLGREYALGGQEKEASRMFADASDIALSLKDKGQRALVLADLAVQEHMAGYEALALRDLESARQSAEAVVDMAERLEALSWIGWALASMGKEGEASELFDHILGQAKAGGFPVGVADSIRKSVALAQLASGSARSAVHTLASIHELSLRDQVILKLLESEDSYRQLGESQVKALLDDLGEVETRIRGFALFAVQKALQGKVKESERLFQRARNLSERIPEINSKVRTQVFLARQLIYAGIRNEGVRLLDALITRIENGMHRELKDSTLENLARSLAEVGLHKDSQKMASYIRDREMGDAVRKFNLNLIAVNAILDNYAKASTRMVGKPSRTVAGSGQ